MKTFLLAGFELETMESEIRNVLEGHFGIVHSIEIVSEGNPQQPLALVHMDVDDATAFALVQRVSGRWHKGHTLSVRLLLHGDAG